METRKNLKFELIIPYYRRPQLVLNALESIQKSNYTNWHLTFIDDSGDANFKDALFNYGLDNSKVTYLPIMMSEDDKAAATASVFGSYINSCIYTTDADIIVTVCDDDAILPDYLENLNTFYTNNPNEMWCYSHNMFYNPEIEHYTKATITPADPTLSDINLNAHTEPIIPSCLVDSSQVSFRTIAFTRKDIKFPSPCTKDLDRNVFEQMYPVWGLCPFAGCIGQYKGWFENQLGQTSKPEVVIEEPKSKGKKTFFGKLIQKTFLS